MKTAEELRRINEKRSIDQVCYVTDDYRRTIEYLTEKLNMGPWTIIKNNNNTAFRVKLDGEKVEETWNFYLAFTKVGNMGIEVIQPDFGPNPYSRFLEEKGPGIHHIKESIYSGDDDLRAYMKELEARNIDIIYEGCYMEDIYYYVDTNKDLGAYLEVGNSAKVSGHPQRIGYYPEE